MAWNQAVEEQLMILIVEDHKDTREALVKFLQSFELDTAGAEDGDQALKIMGDKTPHLVILDWHMPGKSGLDVLREMRRNRRLKDTSVLFYTADSKPEMKEEALRAGAQRVLLKGTDWLALVDEIADMTSVRPSAYQN